MAKIAHGEILSLETAATDTDNGGDGVAISSHNDAPQNWPYGYMFPWLQSQGSVLPESPDTVKWLRDLGSVMAEPDPVAPGIPMPTVYTFLGQFISHDISLEQASDTVRNISKPDITPIPLREVRNHIVNSRSPNLDLDSVYDDRAPRTKTGRMIIGRVSKPETLPHGKSVYNDLPRGPKSTDPRHDREALIGDSRNDENLILSQLHVAFLHAHNALIDRGYTFEAARTTLIQHYQWIVLDDFLERIAMPSIVRRIRYEGPKFFDPSTERFVIPLEFSVAAYRFGHSKVRETYIGYNTVLGHDPTLSDLFMFTRLSGNIGGPDFPGLPGNWVIEWTNFISADSSDFFSRPIDTTLSPTLLALTQQSGDPLTPEPNLAIRNLLRGYILRLPTGQAVAEAMKIVSLGEEDISQVVKKTTLEKQLAVLKDSGFLKETPLWFYILAEAAFYTDGNRLGPVGSTIVAEVLIGVLRLSDESILADPSWTPYLGRTPGKFDITDLFRLAGVLLTRPA